MTNYLAVAIGGALGAVARYVIGSFFVPTVQSGFPYGTFLVNVSGSFAIGFFLTLLEYKLKLDPVWRLAIATGFLGAYTTFSTFEFELLDLLDRKMHFMAVAYVLSSLMLGLIAVLTGSFLARRLS
ncbi:MAG: fluoride efflux transporter CrcB [Acidobacteriota bacterium]|nr:fluoride efflux transporter CrcB [Blastocatellia bacterium]MDW8411733.1 fluoride efflux transporter CrcB [Acidobacteriota bacterium]